MQDLKVGTAVATALQHHALVVERVPHDALNAGAVTSAALVRRDVVVQPIYAGEQVTARRLGQTGEAGIHSVLSGSERIIQVAGDPDQLLAGSVRDGDHVDILASVKAGTSGTPYTAYAARNVVVLDAPSDSSSDSTGSSTSSATATVELTDAQAAALFYVMKNGDWAFVLRPATHPGKTSNPAVGAGAILKGGS
jgi:Flp pilus assembly protein CpaB